MLFTVCVACGEIRKAEVPEIKNVFLHFVFPASRQTAIHCKTEGLQQHFMKKRVRVTQKAYNPDF